ncbi:MAG: NAD(P)H-hydrate dehydratase [Candidatus Woykebacteria bacterium]
MVGKEYIEETNKKFWDEKYDPDWVGPGEVKALDKPKEASRKGENGQLFVIAGSEFYHGALVYAAKIASKFVDLIFVYSTPDNLKIIQKIKENLAEFVPVNEENFDKYLQRSDTILMGPGLGTSDKTRILLEKVIEKHPDKKFLLDADALKVLKPEVVNQNFVVTPHSGEFKTFFGVEASKEAAIEMAKKYGCMIVMKGPVDYICGPNEYKEDHAGNQGMTKGGTGDVLAGMIAAFMTKNDNFLAACAGTFLIGLAGDRLKEKVSYWYSATDVIDEVPMVRKWCEAF